MGAEIGATAFDMALDKFVRDDLDWCNIVFPYDVDDDGAVTFADASVLIEEINRRVVSSNETGLAESPEGVPDYFYDVTNDGYIVPRDVLAVVNRLNSQLAAEPPSFRAVAIPEPSASVLALMCFVISLCAMRRSRFNM